jgi:hypothetical protein
MRNLPLKEVGMPRKIASVWHDFPMIDSTDGSHQLNLVGVSDDGNTLFLENDEGVRFNLEVDDSLVEAVAINKPSKEIISSEEIIVETVVVTSQPTLRIVDNQPHTSVKEIQSRLRAGELASAIAASSTWNEEKIEKFSGPIYQERAYIIEQALKFELKKNDPLGASNLGGIVAATLSTHGVDLEATEWNTFREQNGDWCLYITFPSENGVRKASWSFNSEKNLLASRDDEAKWLCGEKQSARQRTPGHGFLTSQIAEKSENSYGETLFPTPTPAPRLVAVESSYPSANEIIESDEEEVMESVESESRSRVTLPSWDEIIFGGKKEE